MEGPPPPRDASLRNIIDKLAEFVARNGPEFEMITKQKQHGNPKFEFLYGGDYASYYQCRVAAEQAFLKQQQVQVQGSVQQSALHMHHHQQQQAAPTHFTQSLPPIHLPPSQTNHPPHDQTSPFGISQPPPAVTAVHIWGSTNSTQTPAQQANGSNAIAASLTAQIEAINMQQNSLREQIRQSESNLSAQHSALMTQQKKQIDEAIEMAQNSQLEKQAEENSISLKEFDSVLQPIIESCTKDSISSVANAEQRAKLTKLLSLWESKAKFFDACVISKLKSPDSSMQEYKTNLQNLHHEITAKFTQATKATLDNYQTQHQIFIQHATQQIAQLEQQKQQMEHQMLASVLPNTTVRPPANTQQTVQPQQQQQQQPNKIPSLMSQKITMPSSNELDPMKPPGVDDTSFATNNNGNNNQRYQQQQQQQSQSNSYGSNGNNNFQQQHGPVSHNPFIKQPELMQQVTAAAANFFIPDLSKPPPGFMTGTNGNNVVSALATAMQQQQQQQQQQSLPQQQPYGQIPSNIPAIVSAIGDCPPNDVTVDIAALNAALQLVQQHQQQQQQQQQLQNQHQIQQSSALEQHVNQLQQQQHMLANSEQSSPPLEVREVPATAAAAATTIAINAVPEEDQKPSAPYYDLPAGLMVPLIRLEDYNYKPLDPSEIRLPPPMPQSERLTNALAAFYAPPTHDRPRDTEGWEKLGLYEYYKVKNAARKQKEEEIKNNTREKSRSPTPIIMDKPKPKKVNKRCYRSKSRSRSKSHSPVYRSRSRSPPPPPPSSRSGRESRQNRSSRYSQRNRSPRRSPSARSDRSDRADRTDRTDRERDSSSNSSRSDRVDRSSTRRERERSVTPPSFLNNSFTKSNEFIEESNKGHQMLMKMGWAGSGTGLGTKNQGIDQPISAGEVRDRRDMYKGVGINLNDPFENFRKNKGAAFVHRMRARDEKS